MKKILAITLTIAGAATAAYVTTDRDTRPALVGSAAAQSVEPVTIWRSPGCGCCDAYAEYLRTEGFEVNVIDDRDFDQRSVEMGVPERGIGCHLSTIDGYVVSGLVPAEIIERLLAERPDITGITLPGMPPNAPGMAPAQTGTLRTFAFGPDGVSVYSDE
ncbi:DUF411 domain-containing protein [Alterinioella nitratireducens]|jgi:hypothetical protein|uniref:DUF411 domain-containing protein n=1 Tax=Alterinioella nitratireducens TaxID=2735915 RepID=UPI000C362F7B|nr:DUF411 domain-containing protein [Alterinioella nitratireducens]MAX74642.1 metal-binding protein [Nioella sp.]NPD20905.1 metal-binding protein [Alterinioella nitratireducens]|tara:strand:- start:11 stop:490 length:480 start_codon:yes stop_codon:yes gene_type:complete